MTTYSVLHVVYASTVTEVEADNPEQAIEIAGMEAHISVCHQCSSRVHVEDLGEPLEVICGNEVVWTADADQPSEKLAQAASPAKFAIGDRVRKTGRSSWQGIVVGTYRSSITEEGYAVESECHPGSVQIYPAEWLEAVGDEG